MVSRRRFDVKLIDFGRARKITTYEGEKIPKDGTPEFMGKSSLMCPLGSLDMFYSDEKYEET